MSTLPTSSNKADVPAHRYDALLAGSIETRWQQAWAAQKTYEVPNPGEAGFDASKPKFYCLDMFPYPSGAGLHIGHPEGYTATDIVSRYKRMRGFNVLHPMGWDAFGLPAEQYAIQTGVHPAITTKQAIDNFRRQLQRFGFSYDWSREFGTIDPEYYKWTQWIFVQLYDAWCDAGVAQGGTGVSPGAGPGGTGFSPVPGKARPIRELEAEFASGSRSVRFNPQADEVPQADRARDLGPWSALDASTRRRVLDSYRLAYQSTTTVNWCPKLGTVLANDEVIDGKSERGGFPVLRKPLKQWMFRITAYADRLIEQLESLDWPSSTKAMQREWIGRSEGAEVEFGVGRLSEPTPSTSSLPRAVAGWGHPHGHPADAAAQFAATFPHFVACDPYPKGEPSPDGLIAQVRNLPHVELPDATYFVTFGTSGWHLSDEGKTIVMKALMHFDGERCEVLGACVMSNHVHWLVKPLGANTVRELAASVKRFSATKVNNLETMSGSLWQADSFDHIVRDDRWLGAFVKYIARNPVEAKLVSHVGAYRWTYLSPKLRAQGQSLGLGAERWASTLEACEEGRSVGSESRPTSLRVFTTRPDTLFGATYMVVAPEHPLCAGVLAGGMGVDDATRTTLAEYVSWARNRSDVERQESKEKTGAFTGLFATNPVHGKAIPIWTSDYVMMGYGTGAIMAVPAHDERDFAFAKKFALPIVQVVQPPHAERAGTHDDAAQACFADEGIAMSSTTRDGTLSLDGLPTNEAKQRIISWLEQRGLGTRRVNYKLRDWTFSRQRYWGEPFPIVYDDAGNAYPISASHLPVMLPELADYAPVESDDPQPLLAKAKDWVRTTAGAAGVDPSLLALHTPVTRETNTMPGSAGSSWYAIRYCDPHNAQRLVGEHAEQYWMGTPGTPTLRVGTTASPGVDLYLGGSEHAVGHLLYARFWQNVLFDLGHVACKEPFHKLFHQGLITSFAYQRADKSIVPVDEVKEVSEGADTVRSIEIATGNTVTPIVTKMSKRYKNVVNPDDVIAEFGADTCRLYEMYMGPLEASKPWNPRDIVGCYRFLQRAWRVCIDEATGAPKLLAQEAPDQRATQDLEKHLHRLIKKVGEDIEVMSFNTAIAAMIEFVNACTTALAAGSLLTRSQMERFMLVLQPFAPHLAQEVWSRVGNASMIAHEPWPAFDPALLVESEVELPVSLNGKVRTRVMVPTAIAKDAKALEAFALAHAQVQEAIAGKPVKKLIAVPSKMINIVVG